MRRESRVGLGNLMTIHVVSKRLLVCLCVFAKLYVLVFLETIFVGQKYTNRPFFV